MSNENSAFQLDRSKRAAKVLKRQAAEGVAEAVARLRAHLDPYPDHVRHADCLHVIAREQGYSSWPALKFEFETQQLNRHQQEQRLAQALFDGADHLVRRILERNPLLPDGNLALLCALLRKQDVFDLLDQRPELATQKLGAREPILHVAFSRHVRAYPDLCQVSVEIASRLITLGASANASFPVNFEGDPPGGSRLSALYGALGHADNLPLARYLLQCGADPNDGESFYHSTELGHLDGVRLMMEFKADIGDSNAFFRMLDFDNLEGAKLFLEYGADVSECPAQWMESEVSDRGNALHHAIKRGRDGRFVELLIEAGADPMQLDQGRTAYALAVISGNGEAARALRELGYETALTPTQQLFNAANENDEPAIRSLLEKSPDLISQLSQDEKIVPVELARTKGGLATLQRLAAAGVDMTVVDDVENLTPLHAAAWYGYADHVEWLLSHRQDLEHRNRYGANALGTAIHGSANCPLAGEGDYLQTISLLLNAGVRLYPERGDLIMGSEHVTLMIEDEFARISGESV